MAHAFLSPSSAPIWSVCTPAPRAAQEAADKRSVYADRGTFGHSIVEHCLTHGLKVRQLCGVPAWEASEFFTHDLQDMAQQCLDYVDQRIKQVTAEHGPVSLFIESQVSLHTWAPESFGTADIGLVAPRYIEVIDWKFGEGVWVDAQDNPQLRLYGLGFYDKVKMFCEEVDRVRVTAFQPFLSNISSEEIPLNELLEWGEWIRGKAVQAWNGEGEFVVGDHCTFCRIRATCKARAEANMEAAKREFFPPTQLSVEEIAQLLPKLDGMISWASALKEHALQLATSGTVIPGHKLVEGRSNRRYTNPEALAAHLIHLGYTKEQITNTSLKGITELEKIVGIKIFAALAQSNLDKPRGKPVLVPLSDKRPALTGVEGAINDFSGDLA